MSGELTSVSTFPECPKLPENLDIDGREVSARPCPSQHAHPELMPVAVKLFGRMMQEANVLDERVVEAIRRIRGTIFRVVVFP